jgi:hypothetical protein
MFGFVWAAAAISSIPLILFAAIHTGYDGYGLDMVYAMLSGSIVGLAIGLFALAKGIKTHFSTLFVFAGIIGAIVGWVFGLIVLQTISVNLFSTTALAFDLVAGLVGAASVCFFLLGRFLSGLLRKVNENSG